MIETSHQIACGGLQCAVGVLRDSRILRQTLDADPRFSLFPQRRSVLIVSGRSDPPSTTHISNWRRSGTRPRRTSLRNSAVVLWTGVRRLILLALKILLTSGAELPGQPSRVRARCPCGISIHRDFGADLNSFSPGRGHLGRARNVQIAREASTRAEFSLRGPALFRGGESWKQRPPFRNAFLAEFRIAF